MNADSARLFVLQGKIERLIVDVRKDHDNGTVIDRNWAWLLLGQLRMIAAALDVALEGNR